MHAVYADWQWFSWVFLIAAYAEHPPETTGIQPCSPPLCSSSSPWMANKQCYQNIISCNNKNQNSSGKQKALFFRLWITTSRLFWLSWEIHPVSALMNNIFGVTMDLQWYLKWTFGLDKSRRKVHTQAVVVVAWLLLSVLYLCCFYFLPLWLRDFTFINTESINVVCSPRNSNLFRLLGSLIPVPCVF